MAQQAPDRDKALELALAQIEKNHGKGAVMRLGDEVRQPISVIPTGSIALDVALGIGGLPRGRIIEIYGPESSGKTTVALHAVANAQAFASTFLNDDARWRYWVRGSCDRPPACAQSTPSGMLWPCHAQARSPDASHLRPP